MPYITQERRKAFEGNGSVDSVTVGDLNFGISNVLNAYIEDNGLNYTNLNALIGVLECAKLELYRRVAAPYEDKKIKENGDVYTVGG